MSPMLGGSNLIFVPAGPDSTRRVGWGPTLDGKLINARSFTEVAPEVSKDVPVMMGSVSEENMQYKFNPDREQWIATLGVMIGKERAATVLEAMKKAYPEKNLRSLFFRLGGLGCRNHIQRMARLKYELHGAPVYTYYFTWQSPMLEDSGAWHTAELAFCFDNTKRCEQGTGNTPEAQALAKKMATAWSNFASTGNPSQPGLAWTPSDPEHNQTMVFDNKCRHGQRSRRRDPQDPSVSRRSRINTNPTDKTTNKGDAMSHSENNVLSEPPRGHAAVGYRGHGPGFEPEGPRLRQHQNRRAPAGAGNLFDAAHRPLPTRNTERCAATSMETCSPSRACLTGRTRPAKTAGCPPSLPSRGRTSTRR